MKLWLWKNGDHYWAFEHLYPCYEPGGDPMTLGEPVGYALLKASFPRDEDPTPPMADDLVVHTDARVIAEAYIEADPSPCIEQERNLARAYLERDAQLAEARKPCVDSCEAMLIVESQDLRLHALKAQLAAMTAARDDLLETNQRLRATVDKLWDARDKLTASEAARERLQRMYAEYVAHMEDMESRGDLTEYGRDSLNKARRFLGQIQALAEPGKAGEP